MSAKFFRLSIACVFALAVVPSARAQVSKSSSQVRSAFGDVCAVAAKSTVQVYSGGKVAALGVVVDRDGFILTKHSLLKDKLTCKLANGKVLDAELLGHDVPCDLALLKIDATDVALTPIEFCDSKCAKVGHWVCSPDPRNNLLALGVVSVASREIKNAGRQLAGPPKAFMGVQFDIEYAGVKIQDTVPNSPAQKAGLKANDLILKANGEQFQSSDEFANFVGKFTPGTTLELTIGREEKEMDVKVTLAPRPEGKGGGGNKQETMGSKLSERRGGFPHIITHDSVVRPEDCGGPLVNIEGKVVGINISRAGRTESYAIPAEIVQPLIARLKTAKQEK